jgi:glyoxylase-like metal-dependent hydrolase (beta-lactamase superfamily II)
MARPFAATTQLDHGITAVDTDYVRPILDASHLIVEGGRAAFVDVGTNLSVPRLLDSLQQQKIDVADVDYLFLTHVHLDHAGGAGELLTHLPNAKAVVHPRGARHLLQPEKLIQGTIAVYGKKNFEQIYGGVTPIAEDRLIVVDDLQQFELAGRSLQCFFTEGHARHHYCLWDPASKGVFTGDSFGVSYKELDTEKGAFIFPTSTPIDFDPVEARKSVDRIMAYEPEQVYLTHYSRVTDLPRLADDMHHGIEFYAWLATGHANDRHRGEAIKHGMYDYFLLRLQTHGFTGGPERVHDILDFDIRLNTMGLEVWLDRQAGKNRLKEQK